MKYQLNLRKLNVVMLILCLLIVSCAPKSGITRDTKLKDKRSQNSEESFVYNDEKNGEDDILFEESSASNAPEQIAGQDKVEEKKDYDQTGVASWYGRAFQGRKTASGEKFDMYEMTAAHRKIPFGSTIKVKNLENGKEIIVRVNDRGPYKDNRVLDLSYAAARKLGMLATGKAMVGIKVVGDSKKQEFSNMPAYGEQNIKESVDSIGQNLKLQAGAFFSRKNAEKLQGKIEGLVENQVVVKQEDDLFKVRIIGIQSRIKAERYKALLEDEEIPGFIINN